MMRTAFPAISLWLKKPHEPHCWKKGQWIAVQGKKIWINTVPSPLFWDFSNCVHSDACNGKGVSAEEVAKARQSWEETQNPHQPSTLQRFLIVIPRGRRGHT